MYWKGPIRYVLERANTLCFGKGQYVMFWKGPIRYVLERANTLCIGKVLSRNDDVRKANRSNGSNHRKKDDE